MSFISYEFFASLLVAGGMFYILPSRFRAIFLLILSYGFYSLGRPYNLLLLIGASGAVYWLGLKIAEAKTDRSRNVFAALGIVVIAGLLIGYKAAGALEGIILPLGLSYYSFKLLSYLIEVYWDESVVERNPLYVFLYPAFFPQIISGPIQRPDDFFEQIRRVVSEKADYERINSGFRLIIGGLMLKMLIGDRLAAFIEAIDKSPDQYRWPVLAVTILCYTLQLYADFAGYTNIAIGIGKIFGIDSPPNFAAPFGAPNIQMMWQRWHMSLTTWLTDYLFSPLQMSFRHLAATGLILSISINMISVGVWHGFTLNYLVFGIIHSVFLIATVFSKKLRDKIFGKNRWVNLFRFVGGCVLTFLMMTFSQIFFHAETFAEATTHLKLLLHITPNGLLTWKDIRTEVVDPVFICMAISAYVGMGCPGVQRVVPTIRKYVPVWAEFGFYLFILSSLTIQAGTKFIYGQF